MEVTLMISTSETHGVALLALDCCCILWSRKSTPLTNTTTEKIIGIIILWWPAFLFFFCLSLLLHFWEVDDKKWGRVIDWYCLNQGVRLVLLKDDEDQEQRTRQLWHCCSVVLLCCMLCFTYASFYHTSFACFNGVQLKLRCRLAMTWLQWINLYNIWMDFTCLEKLQRQNKRSKTGTLFNILS